MSKVPPSEQVSKEIKQILAGQMGANENLLDLVELGNPPASQVVMS